MKMKNFSNSAFKMLFVLFAFLIFSCTNNVTPEPENPDKNWTGESRKWTPDTETGCGIYELPNNVKTLHVSVGYNMALTMLRSSVGEAVPQEDARYILKVTDVRSAANNDDTDDGAPIGSEAYLARDGEHEMQFTRYDHAEAQKASSMDAATFAARYIPSIRSASGPNLNVVPINPEVGITKKDVYVDLSDKGYTLSPATLRANGKHCYVWVVDAFFGDKNSGAKVDSKTAKKLADYFDKIYPLTRQIFGEEADIIHVHEEKKETITKPIGEVSDTGKKVNIVVFDIGGDYAAGQSGGTYGYFYSRDYNSGWQNSNIGKYIYVDSYFSHITERSAKDMYSTLAHEFQHMINYNQKQLKRNSSSATWYNEMLSMLCEDVLQDKIDTKGTMEIRETNFCTGYSKSGLLEWLSGRDVLASYGVAYMFGSFLVRNYGGIGLLREMATNDSSNEKSVVDAVNKINETNKTFDDLFKEFTEAVAFDHTPKTNFTFNKSISGVLDDDTKYTFSAINLQRVEWKLSDISGKGPAYFKQTAKVPLRQYGFALHGINTSGGAGTVILSFSKPKNENEKIYILAETIPWITW